MVADKSRLITNDAVKSGKHNNFRKTYLLRTSWCFSTTKREGAVGAAGGVTVFVFSLATSSGCNVEDTGATAIFDAAGCCGILATITRGAALVVVEAAGVDVATSPLDSSVWPVVVAGFEEPC